MPRLLWHTRGVRKSSLPRERAGAEEIPADEVRAPRNQRAPHPEDVAVAPRARTGAARSHCARRRISTLQRWGFLGDAVRRGRLNADLSAARRLRHDPVVALALQEDPGGV